MLLDQQEQKRVNLIKKAQHDQTQRLAEIYSKSAHGICYKHNTLLVTLSQLMAFVLMYIVINWYVA